LFAHGRPRAPGNAGETGRSTKRPQEPSDRSNAAELPVRSERQRNPGHVSGFLPSGAPPAPLLTANEASEFLRVPVSTLAVWRSTGRVALPYVKVGGHVRYRREDIEHYLSGADHGVKHMAQTGGRAVQGDGPKFDPSNSSIEKPVTDRRPESARERRHVPRSTLGGTKEHQSNPRLEAYLERHSELVCERCAVQVEPVEARIVSHFELPSFEGPCDPYDWHCFCATCLQVLTQPLDALRTPKSLGPSSGNAASQPSRTLRMAP
jgi:excisionase family DNA binding protein